MRVESSAFVLIVIYFGEGPTAIKKSWLTTATPVSARADSKGEAVSVK